MPTGRHRGGAPAAFVVFGDDWGRHVSTMQHVFGRITRRATVVWLNAIGHREPGLADVGRAVRKAQAMLFRERSAPASPAVVADDVQPPQYIVQPRVLPWHSNPIVAAANRSSLKNEIRRTLARAGIDDFVMVTGSPPSARVIGECGERASIYFCMDDFLVLPGTTPRMLAPLEQELLRRVDAVVATAQRLVEKKVAASRRGYHLPQGVNYAHFSTPREIPHELRDLPRPIVGFAGGVGPAVDVESLHAIAKAIPGGSLVLIGPVTLPAESLRAPNIHVLGPRPYAELPAYVQAFDVGIIPYVENDWTRAVDPLKLLEYLAAGVPVVASPLPEVKKYAHAVTMAELGAPFAGAVARVAGGTGVRGPAAQRVASEHSWDSRADRFLEIVDEVVEAVDRERGAERSPAATLGRRGA
jgi:glycosyltransferase involved in cell wall biosynthesis